MRARVRTFLSRFRMRLRDPRFWVIQILVIAISVGHAVLEATHSDDLPDAVLLPTSIYFIPVIYAALNFGVEGAVPTALWASFLTIPNLVIWHTGTERPGVATQLLLLTAIGYVTARRVDLETAAKERAEAANASLSQAQSALEDYVRLAVDAQEEERKRLARELHDDTIQTLAVAKAEVDSVAGEVSPAGLRSRLEKVDATLESTIDNVRRFSRDLRPALLDDLGLVSAVDWLVGDLAERTGIDAQVQTSGEPRRLEPKNELRLFRIVQEALHNAERHAEASTIEVRIEFGEAVRVTVSDDGRGFDSSEALHDRRSSRGLGLLGIRERAKLAGAPLSIESRPSGGTRVTVTLGPAALALGR
jgi:two-component system sensor histidine kinase DegS